MVVGTVPKYLGLCTHRVATCARIQSPSTHPSTHPSIRPSIYPSIQPSPARSDSPSHPISSFASALCLVQPESGICCFHIIRSGKLFFSLCYKTLTGVQVDNQIQAHPGLFNIGVPRSSKLPPPLLLLHRTAQPVIAFAVGRHALLCVFVRRRCRRPVRPLKLFFRWLTCGCAELACCGFQLVNCPRPCPRDPSLARNALSMSSLTLGSGRFR
ncbi:hypothetical protein BKA81DRAFT_231768 [Phyllosticta paracitricarpa]